MLILPVKFSRMKGLVRGIKLLSILPFLVPVSVLAEEIPVPTTAPNQLIISEIKVNNDATGLNEFIELYNNSDQAVELGEYQLTYLNVHNPTTQTPVVKQLEDTSLAPYQYYVLARVPEQIPGSIELTTITSLKDSEGDLRLLGPDVIIPGTMKIYDEVVWFKSSATNPLPDGTVEVPDNTKSLQRVSTQTATPIILDLDWQAEIPSLFSYTYVAPPPADENEETPPADTDVPPDDTEVIPGPQTGTDEEVDVPSTTSLPLTLTELMPNPAAPLTDTADEYVELYNPNDQAVDLTGYTVQTGNAYSYTYTFSDISLPAHGYLTLTSGNTNLSLANAGGKARLVDSSGVTISETAPYVDAPEGEAWTLINGSWQWTTSPTPGADNVLTLPVLKTVVAAKKTKTTPKKKKAKTASAKVKSASTKKKTSLAQTADDIEEEPEIVPLHPGVLVVVGSLALVYAAWEYRNDISNRIYQFRKYRETRRAARQTTPGD
jgi:hypothetical protein